MADRNPEFKARVGRGRPKGAPNKATRTLRELAQNYTAKGVAALAEIAFSQRAVTVEGRKAKAYVYEAEVRLRAIAMLQDRGHGKAPIALTGPEGEGPAVIERIERVIIEQVTDTDR